MLETQVYVKTDAGRDEIRARSRSLSMPVRAILLMVDGQRTVAGMRALIAGSKAPADVLDVLLAQGLIEARDAPGQASGAPTAERVAAPPAMPAMQAATPRTPNFPPVSAPFAVPPPGRNPAAPPLPSPADGPVSYDGPLDLVLPTIFGPEAGGPVPGSTAGPLQQQPMPSQAPAAPDRYNQIYAAMNEIVRDFLPAHRRYFFQLKIERCGTADELLELLHDLRTALAKGRGDAFAADVIARLRSAAG